MVAVGSGVAVSTAVGVCVAVAAGDEGGGGAEVGVCVGCRRGDDVTVGIAVVVGVFTLLSWSLPHPNRNRSPAVPITRRERTVCKALHKTRQIWRAPRRGAGGGKTNHG